MSKRNLTLLTDLYELTMMQGYYEKGRMKKLFLMYFFVRTLATTDILYVPVLIR